MNPTSGLPLCDATALQRWKSAALPDEPLAALQAEAAAASSRAELLCEKLKLGGADEISTARNQAQQLKAEFLQEAPAAQDTGWLSTIQQRFPQSHPPDAPAQL